MVKIPSLTIPSLAENLAKIQGRLFAFNLERSQLQVKIALTDKLDKDLAKLDLKYDGAKTRALEQEINRLSSKKEELADKAASLQLNLDRLNDFRETLANLSIHARDGLAPSFDLELHNLNIDAGSAVIDADNFIGNPGTGVSAQPEVVSMGGLQTTIVKRFLGTDYAIELDAGGRMRPDFADRTLAGIDVDTLDVVFLSGDDIQFTDGTDTYDGTLARSGSGIVQAWLYNDFATQADRDQARADVAAAVKRLDLAAAAFRQNIDLISAGVGRLDVDMQDLTKDFLKRSTEDLDAKQAERRALTTKVDLTLNDLSLTSAVSNAFIQNLFLAPKPNEKRSLFDIISGRNVNG